MREFFATDRLKKRKRENSRRNNTTGTNTTHVNVPLKFPLMNEIETRRLSQLNLSNRPYTHVSILY
jgi:hypothetical protein